MAKLEAERVYNVYWGRPANIPPSALVRRWDNAVIGGALSAIFVTAFLWLLLWRPLPFLPLPEGGLWLQTKALLWTLYSLLDAHSQSAVAWATNWHAWASQVSFGEAYARPLIAATTGAAIGVTVFALSLNPVAYEYQVGGVSITNGKSAIATAKQLTKELSSKDDPPAIAMHPDLKLTLSQLRRHILFVGGPGSGKTVWLWPLLDQITARKGAKSFIADTKGDFTAGLQSKSMGLLCPWDARSFAWSISEDLTTYDEITAFCVALIPEAKDAYFTNVPRQLMRGVLLYLVETQGDAWGWADIERVSTQTPLTLHGMLKQVDPSAAQLIDPQTDKQASINHASLLAAIDGVIGPLARAWGNPLDDDGKPRKRFSVRAWLRDDYKGPRHIILQTNGRAAPFVGAIVDLASSIIVSPSFSESREREIYFILDELPAFGRLDAIAEAIGVGRSKGLGVLYGFQDFSQLVRLYGRELADAFESMAANHFYFQLAQGETRDRIAKKLGRVRVATLSQTVSGPAGSATTSSTFNEQERDGILSNALTDSIGPYKGGKQGFYIIGFANIAGKVMRLTYAGYRARKLRPQRIPARWTLSAREQNEMSGDSNSGSDEAKAGLAVDESEEQERFSAPSAHEPEQQQQHKAKVLGVDEAETPEQDEVEGPDMETDLAFEMLAEVTPIGHVLSAVELLDAATGTKKRAASKPIIVHTPGD